MHLLKVMKAAIFLIILTQVFVTRATPVEYQQSSVLVEESAESNSIECFEECRCKLDEDDGFIMAICGDGDLVSMPRLDPNDMLKYLDLSHNRLTAVHSEDLENVRDVEVIDLTGNEIRKVDIFSTKLLRNLRRFTLDQNGLSYIHPLTFDNNPLLTHLSVAGNPLQGAFTTDKPFLNSMSLTLLDLSDAQLNAVPPRSFSQLENLEWLDLSDNRLESLSADVFAPLQELKQVYLAGNPWKCGAVLDALKTALHARGVLADESSLSCSDKDGTTRGWFDAPATTEEAIKIPDKPLTVSNVKVTDSKSTTLVQSPSRAPLETDGKNNHQIILGYTILFTNISIISIIVIICIGLVIYAIKWKLCGKTKTHYYNNIKETNLMSIDNHWYCRNSISSGIYSEII